MASSQKPSVLKRLNDKLGLKLNLPTILLMFKYVAVDDGFPRLHNNITFNRTAACVSHVTQLDEAYLTDRR